MFEQCNLILLVFMLVVLIAQLCISAIFSQPVALQDDNNYESI